MGVYALSTISLNQMAGGLERNIIRLANYLALKGKNVHLVTFDWNDAISFYEIDKRVIWHKVAVSAPHSPIKFFDRIKVIMRIRKVLKESNINSIVCFHHGILFRFMSAAIFMKINIVASERNSLKIYNHIRLAKWNINFLLMYLVDKITVQFNSYIKDYPILMQKKTVEIPNAIYPVEEYARPNVAGEDGRFRLLSVGRICAQKNYEALIKAFANLSSAFPNWDLVIVGNGESMQILNNIIQRENLSTRIILPGACEDVSQWYRTSHLFCLPSRWEGFPNALAEALSHGLPAVVYADCPGASNLINNNINGLLADGNGDIKSLREALAILMKNGEMREQMGQASIESVRQYHPDNIFPLWEDMLGGLDRL